MKEPIERAWRLIGWVLFLILGVLVVGVGVDTFFNPGPRFPSLPTDLTWAKLFAALLFGISLLALVSRVWPLMVLAAASGLALILIPLLRSSSTGALLVAIWIGLAAYLLGDAILIWFGMHSLPKLDQMALALATGFAGLMLISTVLGFIGLYYPIAAWVVLGLISFILLPRKSLVVWRFLSKRWHGWPAYWGDMRLTAWGLGVILICGLGAYLWALAPAIRYDSLSYHIPVALNNIHHHAISELPESPQSYWAHYAETLYALGLLVESSTALPGLLHYQMGFLTTLFTFVLGRKLGGNPQGILAAVIFWSLPMVQVEAGSAYIDLFTAAFVTAMLYACWTWVERRDDRWLLLSGSLSGIALGVKLTALFPVGLAGLYILVHAIRQRDLTPAAWRQVLLFALPTLVISAPWFVRDWAWTGNPVFPNYNWIFNSPLVVEVRHTEFKPSGESLTRLFSLPKNLLFKSAAYYHEIPGFALGGLSLFTLPWMYPWLSERKKRSVLIALGVFAALGIALSQQASSGFRYLTPMLPPLAVLASENLLLLWGSIQNRWAQRIALMVSLALGTGYLFATQLALVVGRPTISERYPYRYALGFESTHDFLTRTVPIYSAFRYLEEHVQGPIKILSLGNEFRLYTTAQIYSLSKEAYDLMHGPVQSEELAQLLEKLGYTHLLLYPPEIELHPEFFTSPALNNQFLIRYTQPVYAHNRVRIYRLNHDAMDLGEAPPNVLSNPGFETLTIHGSPAEWELAGNPVISTDGTQAHSGRVAVRITGPSVSGAFQTIPVEAEKIYTLSYWASPEGDGQVLQLYVLWLDLEQEILTQSAEWAHLKPGWNNYQALFTAPEGTAYARFEATTAAPGETWVDDLCMTTASACP